MRKKMKRLGTKQIDQPARAVSRNEDGERREGGSRD